MCFLGRQTAQSCGSGPRCVKRDWGHTGSSRRVENFQDLSEIRAWKAHDITSRSDRKWRFLQCFVVPRRTRRQRCVACGDRPLRHVRSMSSASKVAVPPDTAPLPNSNTQQASPNDAVHSRGARLACSRPPSLSPGECNWPRAVIDDAGHGVRHPPVPRPLMYSLPSSSAPNPLATTSAAPSVDRGRGFLTTKAPVGLCSSGLGQRLLALPAGRQ